MSDTWRDPLRAPEDRYRNDATFRTLVDMLEHMIHQAQYTPSELREAAILAAIHYESMRVHRRVIYTDKIYDPTLDPPTGEPK